MQTQKANHVNRSLPLLVSKGEKNSKSFRVGLVAFLFLIYLFFWFDRLLCHCDRVWQLLNSVLPKTFLTKARHFISRRARFVPHVFLQSFPLLQFFKKVFLKISQDLQENTSAGVFFVIKLHAACIFFFSWILKNF